MKKTYVKPNTNIIVIDMTLLFGTSGERDVIPTHDDDPQEAENALVRRDKYIWGDDIDEEE